MSKKDISGLTLKSDHEKSNNDKMLRSEQNRLRYFESKRIALTLEKKNYSHLYFIQGTGNWVKAFSHSAVIFAEKIGPAINSKAALRVDRDYEVRDETGVVSLPSMDALGPKLEEIGIKLIEEKDGVYVFALGYKIPPDEYNLMRAQNQTLLERTGKMILPVVLMPVLLDNIKKLYTAAFWEVKGMDGAVRELVGADFLEKIRKMVLKYVKMSRNPKSDVKAYLVDAINDIEEVNAACIAIDTLRIVHEKKMFALALGIVKIRNQILYEMKKQGMKDIEKEYGGRIQNEKS